MKNAIFIVLAALFLSFTANAQSTVDSITAKYQLLPMPEALTLEKTFPVIGTYQLNTTAETPVNVTITLDESSKGIVWVEGLPEGKFKAYLKASPATYRIISQKTEAGKQIPEGTLIFDQETRTLNIALGKAFNDAEPNAIFLNASNTGATTEEVKVKNKKGSSKAKIVFYTANKAEEVTAIVAEEEKEVPAITPTTTDDQQ